MDLAVQLVKALSKIYYVYQNNINNREVLVIGLTGPTRSGKTTQLKKLQNYFSIPANQIVMQDNFYLEDKIVNELNNNWEIIESIDCDAFYKNAITAIENAKINVKKCNFVILEGFLLFEESRIFELCAMRIWITLQDEVIIKRRLAKIEWPEIDNEEYLQSIILPQYHKYLLKNQQKKIQYIDGNQSSEKIFQDLANFMKFLDQKEE